MFKFFFEGEKSAEVIVVDGVTTIQGECGNTFTGRRTERIRKLSRKEQGQENSRNSREADVAGRQKVGDKRQ